MAGKVPERNQPGMLPASLLIIAIIKQYYSEMAEADILLGFLYNSSITLLRLV